MKEDVCGLLASSGISSENEDDSEGDVCLSKAAKTPINKYIQHTKMSNLI